jgi:hypothetical protein
MCSVYAATGTLASSSQFQLNALPGTFGAALATAGVSNTNSSIATNGASYTIDVTAQYGTANASNTLTVLTASIEYLT